MCVQSINSCYCNKYGGSWEWAVGFILNFVFKKVSSKLHTFPIKKEFSTIIECANANGQLSGHQDGRLVESRSVACFVIPEVLDI